MGRTRLLPRGVQGCERRVVEGVVFDVLVVWKHRVNMEVVFPHSLEGFYRQCVAEDVVFNNFLKFRAGELLVLY